MKKHDESYRLLFSIPRMIVELLRGFLGQTWIDRVDFESLERVNSSYVSPKLRKRETDIVWRVRLKNGRPVYVYLLLELQSSVQKYMAVRLRSAFATWLQMVRFSGEGMTEDEIPDTLGLEEFRTMLAKRVEEWNEKLLERGRQEGRQEGEAGLVLSLLEQKFGPLDARNRKRVLSADEARLLAWAKRTLVAERISDVFTEG